MSNEELEFIIASYKFLSVKEMSDMLGLDDIEVYKALKENGLKEVVESKFKCKVCGIELPVSMKFLHKSEFVEVCSELCHSLLVDDDIRTCKICGKTQSRKTFPRKYNGHYMMICSDCKSKKENTEDKYLNAAKIKLDNIRKRGY